MTGKNCVHGNLIYYLSIYLIKIAKKNNFKLSAAYNTQDCYLLISRQF